MSPTKSVGNSVATVIGSSVKTENGPLREDIELNAAAIGELTKLRRQLRQAKIDLDLWQRRESCHKQRQAKEIQSLEEQEKWLRKLKTIKLAEKPPRDLRVLINKYNQNRDLLRQARYSYDEAVQNYQKMVKFYDNLCLQKTTEIAEEPMNDDRLEQATTQYIKVLARNAEIRREIQQVLQEKSRFTKDYRDLAKKRTKVSGLLDRLYEESTSAFREREELRIKINLLRDKLETSNNQSQREILEYRRLMNSDEKINTFLATKTQPRCLVDDRNVSRDPGKDDDNVMKEIQEWSVFFDAELGESDFVSLVDQYLADLEQCHVLYGLVAQRNSDFENRKEEILASANETEPTLVADLSNVHVLGDQLESLAEKDSNWSRDQVEDTLKRMDALLKVLDLQTLFQTVHHEADDPAENWRKLKLGFTLILDRVTETLAKK